MDAYEECCHYAKQMIMYECRKDICMWRDGFRVRVLGLQPPKASLKTCGLVHLFVFEGTVNQSGLTNTVKIVFFIKI